MFAKELSHEGHLIDSGLLSQVLNLILAEGADYQIIRFDIGKVPDMPSSVRFSITADSEEVLTALTDKLIAMGARVPDANEAVWQPAPRDKNAPEGFYSTTNHRTEVYINGRWTLAEGQRMDAAIVLKEGKPVCTKLRDLNQNDSVLVGSEAVRVHPAKLDAPGSKGFSFMSSEVSSERNAAQAAGKTAEIMREIRRGGGKIVVIAGPVAVHTGGSEALAELVREGWINGFLGGNAIAVHDLEYQLFGTSLGIDLRTGMSCHEGHKHHIMAINEVYGYGSIRGMMDAGKLSSGLMYEVIRSGIPYSLAGSIRDDGPLPETEMDMIAAQQAYADILQGTDLVIMLASMLHSIGAGNMLPDWVSTVCVDINPAVVTKLSDRGSSQVTGVVSDVGLFLRALAGALGSKA